MSIASIILQQLGGRRFVAFTGSKDFIDNGDGLTMRLARNKSKANRLTITLMPTDTYTVRFWRFTPSRVSVNREAMTVKMSEEKVTEVAQFEDIYCDQLQELFTDVTGLYTRF